MYKNKGTYIIQVKICLTNNRARGNKHGKKINCNTYDTYDRR